MHLGSDIMSGNAIAVQKYRRQPTGKTEFAGLNFFAAGGNAVKHNETKKQNS